MILVELKSVFSEKDVYFERFHDMVARKIAGKRLPGSRTLIECHSSHQSQPQKCCENKKTILEMIKNMEEYTLGGIRRYASRTNPSRTNPFQHSLLDICLPRGFPTRSIPTKKSEKIFFVILFNFIC